jgi:hypothetical protein
MLANPPIVEPNLLLMEDQEAQEEHVVTAN